MKTHTIDDEVLQHIVHIENSMAMAKLTAQMFMAALQQLDGYEWGFSTVLSEMMKQNEQLVLKFLEESGASQAARQEDVLIPF